MPQKIDKLSSTSVGVANTNLVAKRKLETKFPWNNAELQLLLQCALEYISLR